jgi:endonuclease/exonuclease/phosphatase family metal-dependent hydrolase
LPEFQEIYLDAHPESSASRGRVLSRRNYPSAFTRVSAIGRRLLRLPGLHRVRTLARRAMVVAEPAGWLTVRAFPEQKPRLSSESITVISANLWHDWPRHRRVIERLETFSRLVERQKADVVLLQEVARMPDLWVDRWLSDRLGMAYVYSRANGGEAGIGFEEGLAVFSRFPLSAPHLVQLGDGSNSFVRRLALSATIETDFGRVLACSVHLGITRRQNITQMAHLRDWVAELAGEMPALIGGDFNAHEATSQIRQTQTKWLDTFRHLHPKADGATHELRWPWGGLLKRSRLDYIFLQPGKAHWRVMEARNLNLENQPHSDHYAVLTRLVPVFP